jgi:SAM-dependent methyltransferase
VAVLLVPFYFARRSLLRELRPLLARLHGEVLDVGCGRKPYRDWVPAARYVGVDLDSAVTRTLGRADIFYDGRILPFSDASFDAVLCSQVLEHVFTPSAFLQEVARVLRPGGLLLLTVPFAWDEHEQPQDFGRYSSFGVRAVLAEAGFEVVEQRKSCVGFYAIVQLAAAYMFKVTRTRSRPLNLVAQLLLVAPVNLVGGLLACLLPRHPDLYLDNVVLARRSSGTS